MIIYKIPKPITLIGENSNKCMIFSSCNFTYISKLFSKNKFLLNISYKNFIKKYISFLSFNKKRIFDSMLNKEDDLFSCHNVINGGISSITKIKDIWFSETLEINENFLNNILIFYIKKKYFKYELKKEENDFNKEFIDKLVDDAIDSYYKNDLKHFGKIIDSYWRLKIQTDKLCRNNYISKIYSDCILAGAFGGKMDENIMTLIAPKEKHDNIKNLMKDNILLNSKLCITGIQMEDVFSGSSNCCR